MSSSRPPLVLSAYIAPYLPTLRLPLYYLVWFLYYLSYLISPLLLTFLQLVLMFLEHLLPRLERWIEREVRGRLAGCEWAQWQGKGTGTGRTTMRESIGGKKGFEGTKAKGEGASGTMMTGAWSWIVGGWLGSEKPNTMKKPENPIPLRPIVPLQSQPRPTPIPPVDRFASLSASSSSASKARDAPIGIGSNSAALARVREHPHPHMGRLGSYWNTDSGKNRSPPLNQTGAGGSIVLRQRQFSGLGGSGASRRLPYNFKRVEPHPDLDAFEDHDFRDERGSVWSGNGWRAA
ncbi:uncharacterized protein JCM6883_002968 [Sporobolomyces salmoneus]|uniref:uncharacterized protein n=1 Tax=Sporobolomyces salmoneus TaxID=183962 RepID=UPI003176E562